MDMIPPPLDGGLTFGGGKGGGEEGREGTKGDGELAQFVVTVNVHGTTPKFKHADGGVSSVLSFFEVSFWWWKGDW